ncbi:MAG: hypothetical protein ACLFP2_02045 [Candidatus Woesearchaeota archaeon]
MREFKILVGRLADLVKGVDLSAGEPKSFLSYKDQKQGNRFRQVKSTIELLKTKQTQLDSVRHLGDNARVIDEIKAIVSKLTLDDSLSDRAQELAGLVGGLSGDNVEIPPLPYDIRDEVTLDIKEMHKCFSAGCFRSVVILCGRVIEVALHRKYFEATGQDILEKNPGIGLGKLIAKLSEKNVAFDPGLTQQIHLINQVRISSVHKKEEAFYPSQSQAQAIMLFTLDVLSRMF